MVPSIRSAGRSLAGLLSSWRRKLLNYHIKCRHKIAIKLLLPSSCLPCSLFPREQFAVGSCGDADCFGSALLLQSILVENANLEALKVADTQHASELIRGHVLNPCPFMNANHRKASASSQCNTTANGSRLAPARVAPTSGRLKKGITIIVMIVIALVIVITKSLDSAEARFNFVGRNSGRADLIICSCAFPLFSQPFCLPSLFLASISLSFCLPPRLCCF